MRIYVYIIFAFLSFVSCSKDSCQYAILGGEVINRNTDYVVLFNSEKVIDTVNLDGYNRFLYKIENLNPGFYTFKHGGEIQMVLLEPGDSLMFRLNTFDFDESLVYTGIGAKKNNFLINDFLKNEREEKQIFRLCQMNPTMFQQVMDSIRTAKTSELKAYQERYNTSSLFNKIAQANIDYDYYSSKEVYPFVHYGRNKKKIFDALPEDFYDYRTKVNYNDVFFKDYFNYQSFLKRSFNNIALQMHLEHAKTPYQIWTNSCYNLCKMKVVDSLVTNTEIKDWLLYHYTMGFLARNKKPDEAEKIMQFFIEKNTDKEKNDIILSFKSSINKIKMGASLPKIELRNVENTSINIQRISKKPTVIYFWSHLLKNHFNDSHTLVKKLREKYPEIEFVSINIDDYSKERWINTIKQNNLLKKNEYIFEQPEQAYKQLAIHPITKVYLLDADQKIINAHTNMFSKKFEEELLALISY